MNTEPLPYLYSCTSFCSTLHVIKVNSCVKVPLQFPKTTFEGKRPLSRADVHVHQRGLSASSFVDGEDD